MRVAITKPLTTVLSKNGAVLILSVVLAGAAAYFSKTYIESRVSFYRDQLHKTEPMTEVVVPNRPLQRGETINASLLAVREIPARFADSHSVTGSSFETAIGQKLSHDLDEGRPLLWAHLESSRSRVFSGQVPSGFRAMTIRVDEINSISGFLQPGDRIDFLLTHRVAGEEQIFPLIQNLAVIATGVQTVVDESLQGGGRTFTTITVKVSPEEAKKLALSQKIGRLTAMLRNPQDSSALGIAPMSVTQMLSSSTVSASKPRAKQQKNPPVIEYIIGGT